MLQKSSNPDVAKVVVDSDRPADEAVNDSTLAEEPNKVSVKNTTNTAMPASASTSHPLISEDTFLPAINPMSSKALVYPIEKDKGIIMTNAFDILQQESDSAISESGKELSVLPDTKVQSSDSLSTSSSSKQQRKKKRKTNLQNSPGSGGAYSLAPRGRHHH